jgi:adenylate cyclase
VPSKQEPDWKSILEGTNPGYQAYRAIFRRIPHGPRCKLCSAPFEGPGAPLMRLIGRGRMEANPNFCNICRTWIDGHRGGAEVEVSFLFADVRGSTTLGEQLTPAEFSHLLGRFYEISGRVVVEHDGIVDKFVGDEIVAMFVPPFAGRDHARKALDAGRKLIEAVARPRDGGPPLPVGAGMHTGVAFVGAVGGEDSMTDFTALGDAVNTTARLASAAAAGELLVTLAGAAAGGLSTGGLETRHLSLRGRTEAVDVAVLRAAADRVGEDVPPA